MNSCTLTMNKTSLLAVQKGQALVETITVMIVFLILILLLQIITKISDSREGLLAKGLSIAISSARGATLSNFAETEIRHQNYKDLGNTRSRIATDFSTNAMQELGMKSHHWSILINRVDTPIHSMIQGVGFRDRLVIKSSVHVKGFPTHASDSNDVVKHLSKTTHLWGNPASMTSQLSRFVSAQAHLTDVAWKRAKPSQDFLSSWKER